MLYNVDSLSNVNEHFDFVRPLSLSASSTSSAFYFEMATNKSEGGFRKKPNWSQEKSLFLAELIEERKEVIKGKFGPSVTSGMKKATWKDITDRINESISRTTRTPAEVERKWYVIQSKGRGEVAEHRKEMTVTGELNCKNKHIP